MQFKRRPLCEKAITETLKIRPHVVGGRWDGFRAVNPDGTLSHLSQGMKTEMRRLILSGYWPELCQS